MSVKKQLRQKLLKCNPRRVDDPNNSQVFPLFADFALSLSILLALPSENNGTAFLSEMARLFLKISLAVIASPYAVFARLFLEVCRDVGLRWYFWYARRSFGGDQPLIPEHSEDIRPARIFPNYLNRTFAAEYKQLDHRAFTNCLRISIDVIYLL